MEMPIEKPFTGAIFNVALIGVDRIRVRDIIAPTVFKESNGMLSMTTENFTLPSGLDAKLNFHIEDSYYYSHDSKSIFSDLLKKQYSMVVICVDADDDLCLSKLDEMVNTVSEHAKSSAIKMCIVSKLNDSGFGYLIQDTAKEFEIPFFSFESLNTGQLFLQLTSYADEFLNTRSLKIATHLWGRSLDLKKVNKESLVQLFEDAKKDYSRNAAFYKPEKLLNYQINNRLPKNLTNENCCEALCALLKDEGNTTLNSYKFFVITHLLNGDNKISTDEEAKSQIESMIGLLNDFNARGLNKDIDAVTKVMYMRFFAKELRVPKEVTDMITQKYIEVREPENNESSPITPKG